MSSTDICHGDLTSIWTLHFTKMNMNHRVILASLTVFQTGQFDIDAALTVVPMKGKEQVTNDLQKLTCDLWLENDRLSLLSHGQEQSKLYSLHPSVFGFLAEKCGNDEHLSKAQLEAMSGFVKVIYKEIANNNKIRNSSTDLLLKNLQQKLIHIKRFFHITSGPTLSLLDAMSNEHGCRYIPLKMIWIAARNTLNPKAVDSFVKWHVNCSEKARDLYLYVYFKSLEAENLLEDGQEEQASEVIEQCKNEYKDARGGLITWTRRAKDEPVAWYALNAAELKVRYFSGKQTRDVQKLEMALKLSDKCQELLKAAKKELRRHLFHSESLEIVNRKGRIFFEIDQLDDAIKCHESCLKNIDMNSQYLLKSIRCRENLAVAYLKKSGLEEDVFARKALEMINKCVESDVIENPWTLQTRADIYYRLNDDTNALVDGMKALEIVRNRNLMATELLIALEKVARYEHGLGKNNKEASCKHFCGLSAQYI